MIGMMVGLGSFWCSLAVSGGGGRHDLRAASASSMLNGWNLVFLCVAGYVCLRMPAGVFFLNAEDSESTEYIHMMR